MMLINDRITSLVLQGLTMASRFALFVGLARYLEPNEVGIFGVFFASVAFGILTIGLDLYTCTQRELIKNPDAIGFLIANHLAAIGAVYCLVIVGYLTLSLCGMIPKEGFFLFLPILLVEHLLQETNRLLISLRRQVLAAFFTFLRNGAWVWMVLLALEVDSSNRNLSFVLWFWLASIILTLMCALPIIRGYLFGKRLGPLNQLWLAASLKVAATFFVSTILAKGVVTVDRYIIQHIAGNELVAVYSLYFGISMLVVNVLESTVFSFGFQRLIEANSIGDQVIFSRQVRKLLHYTLMVSATVTIVILVTVRPVLGFTGRGLYLDHLSILYVLLGAAVMQSLSLIPHYILYARHADRSILNISALGALVFLAMVFPVSSWIGVVGVAVTVAMSHFFILIGKAYTARRIPTT